MRDLGSALLGATALFLVSTGCQEQAPPEPLWTAPQPPGERTVTEPEWELAWEMGEEDDQLLARPRLLTADSAMVVWWDDFDHRVVAVGTDGQLLWTFGQAGDGPDEFGAAAAVEIDADGSVVVLDSDNGRVVRLTRDGERRDLLRTPEGYWRGLALQPDGTMILSGVDREEPFVRLNGEGEVVERFGPGWPGFERLSLIQRQGLVISEPDGRWLYGFLIGNGWFPYEGSEAMEYVGQSIEHTPFPDMMVIETREGRTSRLVERPNCGICSGWISRDTVRVLFGGYSEEAHLLIDDYRWTDGIYLGSTRLPIPAAEAVVAGELLILFTPAPYPVISAYSVRGSASVSGGQR